jgi:putative selenium metabolism protein SsnA
MSIVLTNALLVDLDPPRVAATELCIDGGVIAARAATVRRQAGDVVVDCGGAVVLPGLVNGHTHLYSALATGMPPPSKSPRNFQEILRYVWWRLDQALDDESIEVSARLGALRALRCGTTTLIDHHASPNRIEGSLDLVERGLEHIGLRGVFCYETTDRHGRAGRERGLEENRRYLEKRRREPNHRFAGLVGAHASFTLDDDALAAIARLTEAFDSGVHIHVAEDPCDEHDARSRRGRNLVDRLDHFGLARPGSIFAHGTHLTPEAIARVNEVGLTLSHNPRSNMNNAVGYAPVASFDGPVMLGTDGIGADMFAEAQAAWMISRHAGAPMSSPSARRLSPGDVLSMLASSARRASQAFGVTLGKLEVGAAADLVVTDYVPSTPLHDDNLAGHLLFGLTSNHVRDVMIDGQWRLRGRVVVGGEEAATRADAVQVAKRLWERLAAIPC